MGTVDFAKSSPSVWESPWEETTMCSYKRLYLAAVFGLFFVVTCSSVPSAPSALTTLRGKQGGTIVYGVVDGATSPATAMARILRNVQNSCGEKPQVGRVFRVRGSNSDAVFFTVTNHAGGNVPVAGMLIASQTGPQAVEAAMVSDGATRFSSTMNPLLSQLFGVWDPGGAAPAPAGKASAQEGAGGGVTLPPMHQVSLADGTGTISLPAGWHLDPQQSGMGMASVKGPQGEWLALNNYCFPWDTNNPVVQGRLRQNIRFQNEIDIPSNVDMTKYFAAIFQRIRLSRGQGPVPLQVASVQAVPGSQGQCVSVTGQLNPDNTTMRELSGLMCRATPNQSGNYMFTFTRSLLPLGASEQQRATANAILASYKPDMQRAQAIAGAQTAPIIAQMNQTYQAHTQALMAMTQQQIAFSQQRTNATLARAQQVGAEHDAQNEAWRRGEDMQSRQVQGFSNYILDQTVVQDNNMYGNGTVGHGTLWNSEADALVKANPNRFEYVPTQNYWRGTDYVP